MRAPAWCQYWQLAALTGAGPGWLLDEAVARTAHRALAIDGGAHIGTWTIALAGLFGQVLAVEPCAENLDCLRENTAGLGNVAVVPAALGTAMGHVHLGLCALPGANSGQRVVADAGERVPMLTIDSLALAAPVALLKLDLEGYELPALLGARETLRRDRPVVVLEEAGWPRLHGLPEHGARGLLLGLGYRIALRSNTDAIFVPV